MKCCIVALNGRRCERQASEFLELDSDTGINVCTPDNDRLQRVWESGEFVKAGTILGDWFQMNAYLARAQLILVAYTLAGPSTDDIRTWWPSWEVFRERLG